MSVGLALLTGCNPLAERRYVNEGAGVNLYTADVDQAVLLEAYTAHVCQQVGPACSPASMTFVLAGMNDIDQRCDGYLTWLDGKRRDREPVLAQIAAVGAAVHAVMTVTGSSPKSLEILSSAFGLATASYTNWNSRLLIAVEQSTIQEVVFNSQGKFRDKIRSYPVTDRPTAIYLLRNYLRLCMPITIEATFNTSTTLVQRSPEAAAAASMDGNSVVANMMPTRPRSSVISGSTAPIRTPPGIVDRVTEGQLGPREKALSPRIVKQMQAVVCVTQTGVFSTDLRGRVIRHLAKKGRKSTVVPDRLTETDVLDMQDDADANVKDCT